MPCKKQLWVRIATSSEELVLRAFYHPRKCMRARQDHLDIEDASNTWLWEVARPQGQSLACSTRGEGILVEEPVLGLQALIRPLGDGALICRGRVYVMVTRNKLLYIGPVRLLDARGEL